MHRPCPPRPERGFNLLELMIALSIAATLLGLAAPAFSGMWQDSQRTVAVNDFVRAIFLARHTALSRGRTISICRSIDGEHCSHQTASWQVGWMVFVNSDRDEPPVRDANEPVLAVTAAWRGGTITSNRRSFSFKPYEHGVINGTLVFCDSRGPTQARAVIINHAGRTRIATRDSDNRPLRCPNG